MSRSPHHDHQRQSRLHTVTEFLAVGGVTLFLLPLSWFAQSMFDLDTAEYVVGFAMFHAAHVLNDPHFAVTYLLFYRDVRARTFDTSQDLAQRVRYVVAGLIVPVVLVAWAASALWLNAAQSLGWMVQLMFLLVGWHYAKQGFGVLVMLSARRGVRFTAAERTSILAHCFSAWAFAWANPATSAGTFAEKGLVYWAPAHPPWFEVASGAAFAISTVTLAITLTRKARNEHGLPWTPLIGFLVTVWFWTVFTKLDPLLRYVIPALHSVQYLYFVWLLTRNESRSNEGPPNFGPPTTTRLTMLALAAVTLGWVLFRGFPSLLDDTLTTSVAEESALGTTPFFAALYVVINLHHYFMDHVIWRRENPMTRHLLQDPEPWQTSGEPLSEKPVAL